MKLCILFTLFALLTFQSFAYTEDLGTYKTNFCHQRQDATFSNTVLFNHSNQLAFRNYGGLMDGGVCWWHSRFTRNAAYIALFAPELPKPTDEEAFKIIASIRKGSKVVIIPGYPSLYEFSSDYSEEIQLELEEWQKVDGFVRQAWLIGLAGTTETTPENFAKKMDALFQYVAVEKNIAYQKLQLPGIDSHAWLVINMKKTANGYLLYVVDSNYHDIQTYEYRRGMGSFYYSGYGEFVPYTGQKRELLKLKKAVASYCKSIL